MSSIALQGLAKKILNDFIKSQDRKEGSTSDNKKGVRFNLRGLPGQLIVINRQDIYKGLDTVLPFLKDHPKRKNIEEAIWVQLVIYLKSIVASYAKDIPKVKLNALRELELKYTNQNTQAYTVKNYYQAATGIKKNHLPTIILKAVQSAGLIDSIPGKDQSAKLAYLTAAIGGKQKGVGFHIGHGVDTGIAVSGIRGLRAEQIYEDLKKAGGLTRSEEQSLKSLFARFREVNKIDIERSQVINKDLSLSQKYVAVLTMQSKIENEKDSAVEKDALAELKKYFETNLLDQSGSTTLRKAVKKVVASKLNEAKKNSKGKVKVITEETPKQSIKEKSKATIKGNAQAKTNKRGSVKAVPIEIKGTKSHNKFMQQVTTKKGTQRNLSLLTILRTQIKKVVAANMVFPRLVYRTGRFANSVEIVDVLETAGGIPLVGYTYMHDPYNVFRMDVGNHLATPLRDPRSIIDLAIRQIAAQFAIAKIYTRDI